MLKKIFLEVKKTNALFNIFYEMFFVTYFKCKKIFVSKILYIKNNSNYLILIIVLSKLKKYKLLFKDKLFPYIMQLN